VSYPRGSTLMLVSAASPFEDWPYLDPTISLVNPVPDDRLRQGVPWPSGGPLPFATFTDSGWVIWARVWA
jgi:hypothetical protein